MLKYRTIRASGKKSHRIPTYGWRDTASTAPGCFLPTGASLRIKFLRKSNRVPGLQLTGSDRISSPANSGRAPARGGKGRRVGAEEADSGEAVAGVGRPWRGRGLAAW